MTETDPEMLPVPHKPLPPREPPESVGALVREHPGLIIAGGIAAGLLVGALLPKRTKSRIGQRAVALASVAAELGLAFSQQARDKAGEAAREGREKIADLSESAGKAGRRAAQSAASAGDGIRDTGLKLARMAIDAASKGRR